jgi:hypothetical protein
MPSRISRPTRRLKFGVALTALVVVVGVGGQLVHVDRLFLDDHAASAVRRQRELLVNPRWYTGDTGNVASVQPFLRRVITGSALIAALAVAIPASSQATTSAAPQAATTIQNILPWMTQQLSEYAGSEYGPFENGLWTPESAADGNCWACAQGGAATAAATLYVLGGESNPTLLQEAEETINTAIAQQQTPDGGFTPPAGDSQPEDIATMFFGVEFGTTYHLLAPYLDLSTKASWQASLAKVGGYLITSGTATWYSNGNINLGVTELLWLVWQATGETQFETDYNNSWAFTNDPPQNKFPGDGWVTVTPATQPDGSGGAGYFTETGAGGTGYDAQYSMLQLDVAARLWLLSGDPRALYAANMLMGQELPRVNTTTWMLNGSNGTRHTAPDTYVGFQTGALAVLGLDGGRSDLAQDVLPELDQEESWYPQTGQSASAPFRRAFGDSVSLIALAAAAADPGQASNVSLLGLANTSSTTTTPTPTPTPTTGGSSTTPTTSVTTTIPAKGSAASPGKKASTAPPTKKRKKTKAASPKHSTGVAASCKQEQTASRNAKARHLRSGSKARDRKPCKRVGKKSRVARG